MSTRGCTEFFNSAIRDVVQVIAIDLRAESLVVTHSTGVAFVEVSAWVRQVWVDNLEPEHVNPVVILFRGDERHIHFKCQLTCQGFNTGIIASHPEPCRIFLFSQ